MPIWSGQGFEIKVWTVVMLAVVVTSVVAVAVVVETVVMSVLDICSNSSAAAGAPLEVFWLSSSL